MQKEQIHLSGYTTQLKLFIVLSMIEAKDDDKNKVVSDTHLTGNLRSLPSNHNSQTNPNHTMLLPRHPP